MSEVTARKREKYGPLVGELRRAGWEVEDVGTVVIGARGVMYQDGAETLSKLGVGGTKAKALMGRLDYLKKHTVTALGDIMRQRRRLERGKGQARAGVG